MGRASQLVAVATKRIGVVLLAALLAAGCGAVKESTRTETSGAARSLPGLTPEKREKLRRWAIDGAAEMGEDRPTDGVVISTTQHHFFSVRDGTTFGTPDFDAYVVAYRGDFTAGSAPRPVGAAAPRGQVTYEVYNADTLAVTDWGLGDLPIEAETIGPWIPLNLEH